MAQEEQAGARTRRRPRRRKRTDETEVRLGRRRANGLAPSLYVWVERGVERRPRVAATLRGRIVFRFDENLSPLLLDFGDGLIEVSDGDLAAPDLTVSGRLPDIVALATAPHVLGVPNPARLRGLSAILRLSSGRVAIDGDRGLALRLIRLLAL